MRVLCIGGGPGFSPAYLVRPVAEALNCNGLPFTGAGDFTEQVSSLSEQLMALEGAGPFSVVAHSWGSLLAIRALGQTPCSELRHLCLVNPVPLDKKQFQHVTARFRRRMALRNKAAILIHALQGDGAAVTRRLLPLYGTSPDESIVAELGLSLGGYRQGLKRVQWSPIQEFTLQWGTCTIIRGEHDVTPPEALEPLAATGTWMTLPSTGHFPMFDAPQPFKAALRTLSTSI